MLWIGLMSGTSADGVDAALVRIGPSAQEISLLGFLSMPFSPILFKRIHEFSQSAVKIRDIVSLDVELGERFAEAARAVLQQAGVRPEEVEGIASHGQTLGHFPEPEVRGSMQLGAPAVIHERTGIPVIADFRAADIAAGGQGAPLTPFFHHRFFARPAERLAVLNIGGFTNVTYLPGLAVDGVIAFDPGPGNALLDRAARWASAGAERFDRDGARAREGQSHREVVTELLRDPYFAKLPPKSTGHDHFGQAFFERARDLVVQQGGTPNDVLATLAQLTAESVVDQAGRFFPEPAERWILYGGGVQNPVLWERLCALLAPAPLELSDGHGIPAEALEAMAFAVLGWHAHRGEPCNLPQATGATRGVVLGTATPAGGFRRS